jgi:hypothetical protein
MDTQERLGSASIFRETEGPSCHQRRHLLHLTGRIFQACVRSLAQELHQLRASFDRGIEPRIRPGHVSAQIDKIFRLAIHGQCLPYAPGVFGFLFGGQLRLYAVPVFAQQIASP